MHEAPVPWYTGAMNNACRYLFLHGLHSSSQGFKGAFLRNRVPDIRTPDFTGSLDDRMGQLIPLLSDTPGWIIVGSSFGGVMGTLVARQHPHLVRRLILLAPALTPPFLEAASASSLTPDSAPPTAIPTVIYHGRQDTVVPMEPVRRLAERLFLNLQFYAVDDDHMLHATVQAMDWEDLLHDRGIPVTLLYSETCPSYELAIEDIHQAVAEAGVRADLTMVRVETEEQSRWLHFAGSPTILVQGQDIDTPLPGAPTGLTCRAYRLEDGRIAPLPSRETIVRALRAAQPS